MGSDDDWEDEWYAFWYEEVYESNECLTHRDEKKDIEKPKKKISRREHFYRQGRTSSITGDHSTAIKFYEEALKNSHSNREKCEMLTTIAEEYETAGNYASAESYLNMACDTAQYGTDYVYLTKKGDFLYRRKRYEEAIAAFERALKSLDAKRDAYIYIDQVKYYARMVHFIIASYMELGKVNKEEKYHGKLRRRIARHIRGQPGRDEDKAHNLCEAAWRVYLDDRMIDEALILIDSAIELHPACPAEYYNTKAIILDGGFRYDEALKCYDKALSKERSNETFLENKAGCIREKLKRRLLLGKTRNEDLDMINEALKTLPKSCDSGDYLTTKGDILSRLGEPVKARICYALAAREYDKVDEAERHLKGLKPTESYINITGTQHYRNFAPLKEGTIVDLIKERDNPHDRYAIRVEIDGETVGYVANSEYTLIKEVKSAMDLKYVKLSKAEVQFILFDEWIIAKLIKAR